MKSYTITQVQNGYKIKQEHFCTESAEGTTYGTEWIFKKLEEATEFLALNFFSKENEVENEN